MKESILVLKKINKIVCDADLPEYAKGEHYLYSLHLRKALENQQYCKNLNIWLDTIFGTKQQSKKHFNVFSFE
jgi:hypothetical protein